LVVGNPANTNAYIAMKSAPDIPAKNFTAMLRLDHNRALSQLANKLTKPVANIEKLVVWGNHSPTMYPDYRFATVDGKSVKDSINDSIWNKDTFIPTVGKRGAAIIDAGKWVTMGIPSKGEYGIPAEVIYGFPVICENGEYKMIEGLEIDEFSRERMTHTLNELLEEQAGVKHLLS
jgi:malate dehydrogenase